MGINFWREVDYVNDGVTEYECLLCRARWSMRGIVGSFCSYCGTRWEGQKVWRTEERSRLDEIRAIAAGRQPVGQKAVWVFQARCFWNLNNQGWKIECHQETDGWTDDWTFEAGRISTKAIAQILAEKREQSTNDDVTRWEWRVILRKVAA